MEKHISDTIEKIIRIAGDYLDKGNVSILTLINESGYIPISNKINEKEIEEGLKTSPHLIDQWLSWSDFKRSYPTWHFSKFDDESYHVSYSSGEKESEGVKTTDKFKACATFIKRELENYRHFN